MNTILINVITLFDVFSSAQKFEANKTNVLRVRKLSKTYVLDVYEIM
ncbi:hypothetical protein [Methanobacterium sp.]